MSGMDVRRVVTGHDASGAAVFLSDAVLSTDHLTIPLAKGSNWIDAVSVWSTDTVPADNSSAPVGTRGLSAGARDGDVFHGGITFRIVDLPPGSSSPMHRTLSLDYAILLSGECDLQLDDGATKTLRAGDVVIQRGTIHSWINRGSEPCRWVWILVEAPPVLAGGRVLEHGWYEAPEIERVRTGQPITDRGLLSTSREENPPPW